MKYNFIFLTLFPEIFYSYFAISIAKRANQRGYFDYFVYNIRDFAKKGRVDDYPYGGGAGMLLKIEPLANSLSFIQNKFSNSKVILISPQGKIFKQKDTKRLLKESSNIIFVCGHYEGFDERILNYVDEQISIGDFITMGGEMPTLTIIDSLIRTIPGVIKEESYQKETFNDSKLDFANYTRPSSFDGIDVPEVLLSGNHKKINQWREENIMWKTKNKKKFYKNKKKRILILQKA